MDQSIIQLSSKHPTIKTLLEQFGSDCVQLAIEVEQKERLNNDEIDASITELKEKIAGLRSKFIQAVSNEMTRILNEQNSLDQNSEQIASNALIRVDQPSWMTDAMFIACQAAVNSS